MWDPESIIALVVGVGTVVAAIVAVAKRTGALAGTQPAAVEVQALPAAAPTQQPSHPGLPEYEELRPTPGPYGAMPDPAMFRKLDDTINTLVEAVDSGSFCSKAELKSTVDTLDTRMAALDERVEKLDEKVEEQGKETREKVEKIAISVGHIKGAMGIKEE